MVLYHRRGTSETIGAAADPMHGRDSSSYLSPSYHTYVGCEKQGLDTGRCEWKQHRRCYKAAGWSENHDGQRPRDGLNHSSPVGGFSWGKARASPASTLRARVYVLCSM